jgi:hypothetical protein
MDNYGRKTMCRILKCIAAMLLAAGQLSVSTEAEAGIITTPQDLNPGDQYRLVFVTHGGMAADNTSISHYNQFVSNQAALSADLNLLGTQWYVIGSTSDVDARDNTNTNWLVGDPDAPIYRLDGSLVATGNQHLWGAVTIGPHSAPINIDQFGGVWPNHLVWTGTAHSGTEYYNGLWYSPLGGGFDVEVGHTIASDLTWVHYYPATPNSSPYRYYAISDVLTVSPVPEPSAFAIWSLMGGVAMMIGWRRRRRRWDR